MAEGPPLQAAAARRDVVLLGEDPDVILADVAQRPRPAARVLVVANEKGGVGKSTIAFHLSVALADAGLRVAACDLDRRQQSLASALSRREGTARRLGLDLPVPRHQVLHIHSGAMLCQEISRIGWTSHVIVIDVAGADSAIARRAIAIADTLITPVNSSFVDLDLLGKFHPTSLKLTAKGCFAIAVDEIRAARIRRGLPDLDWVVAQNRVRRGASQNQARIETALEELAPAIGFRLAAGLAERVAYRELFLLGLTHLDLRRIPEFARTKTDANREILGLVADLALCPPPQPAALAPARGKPRPRSAALPDVTA